MKVKLTVDATSVTRLEKPHSFNFPGGQITVKTSDGIISSIELTIDSSIEHAPQVTTSGTDGVSASIYQPADPSVSRAIEVLRGLEATLALFGLVELDYDSMSYEWIPESDGERSRLKIFRLATSFSDASIPSKSLSPEILAAACVVAVETTPLRVPLTFYRKGNNDYQYGRYLEAIPSFLLMLEFLFAGGKFEKKKVKENFRKSAELVSAIDLLKQDPGLREIMPKANPRLVKRLLLDRAACEITDWIADLRGLLFHQSRKGQLRWDPADPAGWKSECSILRGIAFYVANEISASLLDEAGLKLEGRIKRRD